MFLTGEFSRIARVSKRLLQYYDEIGLLKPAHTDPQSGYRYYSARQLPRLNRILVLKELGLSLEQIARMLDDDISDDEIHGMLLMQKAQVEQSLRADMQRFRQIEARLNHDTQQAPDVILKSIPAQPYLSLRTQVESLAVGWGLIQHLTGSLPPRLGKQNISHLVVVTHSDAFVDEHIDLEVGFLLDGQVNDPITVSEDRVLTVGDLPAVATMATLVHVGGPSTVDLGYGAVGRWIEANHYRMAGPQREVFIELPLHAREEDIVVEIQFPVENMKSPDLLLPALFD